MEDGGGGEERRRSGGEEGRRGEGGWEEGGRKGGEEVKGGEGGGEERRRGEVGMGEEEGKGEERGGGEEERKMGGGVGKIKIPELHLKNLPSPTRQNSVGFKFLLGVNTPPSSPSLLMSEVPATN